MRRVASTGSSRLAIVPWFEVDPLMTNAPVAGKQKEFVIHNAPIRTVSKIDSMRANLLALGCVNACRCNRRAQPRARLLSGSNKNRGFCSQLFLVHSAGIR